MECGGALVGSDDENGRVGVFIWRGYVEYGARGGYGVCFQP